MKPLLIQLLFAIVAVMTAQAQTPLPLILVEKPLHIGDQVQKDMTHSQPDSASFEATFQWNGHGKIGDVYLVIQVSHLVPKDYPNSTKGFGKPT